MSEKEAKVKLQSLEKNLKDLDYVAQQISMEYTNKNKLAEGSIMGCEQCKKMVVKSNKQ